MKKNYFIIFLACSLFKMSFAQASCEVESKKPRVVIKSIRNLTPYNLYMVDSNKKWKFSLEPDYEIDSSSLFMTKKDVVYDTGFVDSISFFAMEIINQTDLSIDNWLHVTISLADHTVEDSFYAEEKKEGELFLFFGITGPEGKTFGYTQKIDFNQSGDIEVELMLYVEDDPSVAGIFKFFGNFKFFE